ncbi:hypothetical protein VII00023_22069 [Vibrio ichthyoenteri ATCC 700023]|uniref:J domain-containing protein n=1 Tax=Vibrio ichthyoenteri ATCC 700023 TaxID=870968 RepID=F9RXS5_9VIBR|nr:SEL1-like repeat protein [Vibrio ichthyoenteri]EGU47494.1 hypothetical protein VII00023_22069 [Vibrio ichthyoenteri ATCC 700023]
MLKKFIASIALISSTAFATTNDIDALLEQAELNNPRAQYQIAQAYKFGEGVAQSSQESLYWLEQAATNRYKLAQRELVDHYLEGQLSQANQDQAFYWLTKLAISGDDQAQFELGQLYEQNAQKVDTLGQAKLWYQIASANNPKAEEAFSRVLEQEFNAQRAKQLAAIEQLNNTHNDVQTTSNHSTAAKLVQLLNPLSLVLLALVASLSCLLVWLWRGNKSSLKQFRNDSEQNLSQNDGLKQQIQQQDQTLRKQKQQLELLYNQLKKHQLALKAKPMSSPASASNKTSHFDLACAMFGYSPTQLLNEKQVKQRYKQLCKIYHPDLKGSEEEMKRLNGCLKIILATVNK